MKMTKTLISAALTLMLGVHAIAYAETAVSSTTNKPAKVSVEEQAVPTINLSIVTDASDLIDGDYLNYQEYMLFEYVASQIVNDDEFDEKDKKDFLGYLNLTRFMVQMDRRHKELKELSANLMKSDKETGAQIVQLIMAEQATLSNESFKFINSTGLAHDQQKLTPRMLYLEQTVNHMINNIDYDKMNAFIRNLKAEYDKQNSADKSQDAENTQDDK